MNITVFDRYKKTNNYQQAYWTARDMAKILWYSEYRKFKSVIKKAEKSCVKSGQDVQEHFAHVENEVNIWSGAKRTIDDVHLSRYACYLIIQNADPNKEVVATGQSYFAIQTRIKEVSDQYKEDQKRTLVREEMTEHNKKLFSAAKQAGVQDFASFYDAGYMGLYGWMRKRDILASKWIDAWENPLDYMSSEELWANLFRATQTEAKLKRESISWEKAAQKLHYDVGQKVRQTIKELWWTMPESLPVVEHIKEAKKRLKSMSYVSDVPGMVLQKRHNYELPNSVNAISNVADIIKNHPWSNIVFIDGNSYKISDWGLKLLERVLE